MSYVDDFKWSEAALAAFPLTNDEQRTGWAHAYKARERDAFDLGRREGIAAGDYHEGWEEGHAEGYRAVWAHVRAAHDRETEARALEAMAARWEGALKTFDYVATDEDRYQTREWAQSARDHARMIRSGEIEPLEHQKTAEECDSADEHSAPTN
jgi:hypothetical protein